MPFGLGLFEIVFVLVALGILVALFGLGAFLVSKVFRRGRSTPDLHAQHLAAELHRAQARIAELEGRLARVEQPQGLPRQ